MEPLTSMVVNAESLSGYELRAMLAYAAEWLERNSGTLNAINVFPVPDGDTGSNISSTMRAAVEQTLDAPDSAGAVLHAAARGALLGARGNSGVILSQILGGIAAGCAGIERLDGQAFAASLVNAEIAARSAVAEPRQGTILTVLADTATAATAAGGHFPDVLMAAWTAARDSVERTPDLLPLLKEAGVVDSGGLGLAIILEGFQLFIEAQPFPTPKERRAANMAPPAVETARTAGELCHSFGYCTEFVITGSALPRETVSKRLRELGDSVLVVGDESLLRVHIHTFDPGEALSLGVAHGSLSRIKVDNIDAQQMELENRDRPHRETSQSVLAFATGVGFENLFISYGAELIRGTNLLPPTAEEILVSLNNATERDVVILPNSEQLIDAAEQAARRAERAVTVLPTRSLPEGLAAVLAFNPERSTAENLSIMRDAALHVRTIELADRKDAPISALAEIALDGDVATIYFGNQVTPSEADELALELRSRRPELEVEAIDGGQVRPDYIISFE